MKKWIEKYYSYLSENCNNIETELDSDFIIEIKKWESIYTTYSQSCIIKQLNCLENKIYTKVWIYPKFFYKLLKFIFPYDQGRILVRKRFWIKNGIPAYNGNELWKSMPERFYYFSNGIKYGISKSLSIRNNKDLVISYNCCKCITILRWKYVCRFHSPEHYNFIESMIHFMKFINSYK